MKRFTHKQYSLILSSQTPNTDIIQLLLMVLRIHDDMHVEKVCLVLLFYIQVDQHQHIVLSIMSHNENCFI